MEGDAMTDRPAPLDPQRIAALLRAFPAVLEAEVRSLPPDVLRWHPAPGEWCVPEALGHLVETEQSAFVDRIRAILAGGEALLPSFDPVGAAHQRRDCDRDVADLLREFASLREASAGFVAGLRADDVGRAGQHDSIGRVAVGDLLHEWVFHDRDHLRQVMANVQRYVWDHLGNTRVWYAGP
jgi:hypothetical protein